MHPYCFDISPLITIFWKLAYFICDRLINEEFNVGVYATFVIDGNLKSVHSDVSKSLLVSWVKTAVHTNTCYQTSHILGELE
jgi:hypothetical protein